MENASKAILMAATVLVGILLISIFTILYSKTNEIAKRYAKDNQDLMDEQFNVQFEEYLKKDTLTPHDIVTIINLAKQIYDTKEYEIEIYIRNRKTGFFNF